MAESPKECMLGRLLNRTCIEPQPLCIHLLSERPFLLGHTEERPHLQGWLQVGCVWKLVPAGCQMLPRPGPRLP